MTNQILYCYQIKHQDYRIGLEFKTDTGIWRCTDIGTRTINAIKISNHDDESWFNGPPYAVQEVVFDENDLLDLTEIDWSKAKPVKLNIQKTQD